MDDIQCEINTINFNIKYKMYSVSSDNVSMRSMHNGCTIFFMPNLMHITNSLSEYDPLFRMLSTELNATIVMPVHISKLKHNLYLYDIEDEISENNWWKDISDTISLFTYNLELIPFYKKFMQRSSSTKSNAVYFMGHGLGCALALMLSQKLPLHRVVLLSPILQFPITRTEKPVSSFQYDVLVNTFLLILMGLLNCFSYVFVQFMCYVTHYLPQYITMKNISTIDVQQKRKGKLSSYSRFDEYTNHGQMKELYIYDVFHILSIVKQSKYILNSTRAYIRVISSQKSAKHGIVKHYLNNPKHIKLFLIDSHLDHSSHNSVNIMQHIIENNDVFSVKKFRMNKLHSMEEPNSQWSYCVWYINYLLLRMNKVIHTYL